jgi:hypothetical protein
MTLRLWRLWSWGSGYERCLTVRTDATAELLEFAFISSVLVVDWLVECFYLAPADGDNRDKAEREEVPFLDRDDCFSG